MRVGTTERHSRRTTVLKKKLAPIFTLCTPVVLAIGLTVLPASAQETVTPSPDPVVGTVPSGSDDAQETHDSVSIQQMMKVVELARLMAGGISQLFSSSQGQRNLLNEIRDAQKGPRAIPSIDSSETEEARDGGEGLNEMAESALNGAANVPADMVEALNKFRSTYDLDKAFELKDDELLGKKLLAQLAAKGIIGAASAESSYKRANASNERLGQFITALEASPDLKTSIDLNTRVMIELTQQSNESLRVQSAVTSMIGSYFMVLAGEASEPSWVEGLKDFNR